MVKGLIFDLIIGKETTHMPTVSAVAASRIVHEVLLRRPDITYIYKRPNKKDACS
jgi:hypothetical protein